jgi:hypothetical protein
MLPHKLFLLNYCGLGLRETTILKQFSPKATGCTRNAILFSCLGKKVIYAIPATLGKLYPNSKYESFKQHQVGHIRDFEIITRAACVCQVLMSSTDALNCIYQQLMDDDTWAKTARYHEPVQLEGGQPQQISK